MSSSAREHRWGVAHATLVALLAAGSSACGSDGAADSSTGGAAAGTGGSSATSPTYHADIEPIVQERCQSCHRPGGLAPFALSTYEDAEAVAGLMAAVTEERRMPPWGAFDTPDCQHPFGFKEDLRLSDAEIALFGAWRDAGAPEGDPADAPPPFDPPTGLPGVSLELAPEPFTTSGEVDQFPCLVIDPGITSTSFLDGWHFIPGDDRVVHHILLFTSSSAVQAADYSCSGVMSTGKFIAGWAPGMAPTQLPEGVAIPIPSGSKLVMQMHYHPGGISADDATTIQLRFAEAPPTSVLRLDLIGNFSAPSGDVAGDGLLPGPGDPGAPAFVVPAGAKDHTEEMAVTVPAGAPPLRILGSMAHMHWLGVDMRVRLESPQSGETCLLATPKYDFAWQRLYQYDTSLDALPTLVPGDRLRLLCTYDNSTDNPYVVDLVSQLGLAGPQDATLGETTYDEMCLTALPLLLEPVATFPICLEACDKVDACGEGGACASLDIDCATSTLTTCHFQCSLDATCAEVGEYFATQTGPMADCLAGC